MKKYPFIRFALFGLAGFALACWPQATKAQTATILCAPGAIQPNGDPSDNALQWGEWYSGTAGETTGCSEVFDPTQASMSTIPGSIHVIMNAEGSAGIPGGAANLAFGDWIVEGFGNQGWLGDAQYVSGSIFDASKYSALSFDMMVNNLTSSNSDIPIYLWGEGYDNFQLGSVTVPASTTNWQHYEFPIPSTISMSDCVAWGFYNWYPNTAPFNSEFWVDNVQLVGKGVIPPPPVSIGPAAQGLNLFTSGNESIDNREDIETVNGSYSWVGASGPVSYSFTLTNQVLMNSNDAVQCEVFLCPNPGTESDVDWQEPSIIFMDLESTTGGGGYWTFRYKTNEPNGNTMIYGSGALAALYDPAYLGTWTLTFEDNTNVTMTTPSGLTTNFDIPDATGATSALFASGVNLYFGVQSGNTGASSDRIAASAFKVSGTSADFDDNFIADAGNLNTNLWMENADFAQCVQMVGPGNPYWITWTLPAQGYTLVTTPVLSTNSTWSPATTHNSFIYGASVTQLLSTNDEPLGPTAYFALVQRAFTQLLVLLPGETNAPNTPTGKAGAPTPISLSGNNSPVITVMAVDQDFFPVSGSYDNIQITSSDSGAVLPNDTTLSSGTWQVQTFYFEDEGTWTVTATDLTNTGIPPATSSPVSVGP